MTCVCLLMFGLYVLKHVLLCVGCDDVCVFLRFEFLLVVCGLCVMCDFGVWL